MTIALIALTTLAIIGACHLYADNRRRIADLEARIAKLEAIAPKRIPYRAAEEALDAVAEIDRFLYERDIDTNRLLNAVGHLHNFLATGTKRE